MNYSLIRHLDITLNICTRFGLSYVTTTTTTVQCHDIGLVHGWGGGASLYFNLVGVKEKEMDK